MFDLDIFRFSVGKFEEPKTAGATSLSTDRPPLFNQFLPYYQAPLTMRSVRVCLLRVVRDEPRMVATSLFLKLLIGAS